MTRPGEACGARWEEIDLEQGTWAIPAERIKKQREHLVPLIPQVHETLKMLEPSVAKARFYSPVT
ncbi:tyrosine-type recombinase/integrase [Aestuariicella hydrocarbonica]|uniref:tyrosine-type recombinase/integrase n=1 Tax=Pseudomaricurvus hydrocarbonicus TaxID=1470433 RepID=UPI001FB85708